MTGTGAVTVRDLRVSLRGGGPDVVHGVSFEIAAGDVLGLVGESGSGKTTVGLAMLGHARSGLQITGGTVEVDGRSVLDMPRDELRALRGAVVSYVPQDPASSLNPALRVGTQLREVLTHHGMGAGSGERVAEMMREVALPDDPAYLRRYPHELSGGQQQRIGLAMAFACRPRLIVLDEPTTGLDVTTQSHVLDTVRELARLHSVAALYVSHDLAVVATLAARVAVMYAGRLVEVGAADELFTGAAHPYTRRLVGAIPHMSGRRALVGIPGRAPQPGAMPPGCAFAPRCLLHVDDCDTQVPELRELAPGRAVRCIRAEEVLASPPDAPRTPSSDDETDADDVAALTVEHVDASYGSTQVLHDISLRIADGECLALVGESGSGKTTLARVVAGMHTRRTGRLLLGEAELAAGARGRDAEQRRRVQYIFQNPYGSLNPRETVADIIARPIELFRLVRGDAVRARVEEMLERVSLSAEYGRRYPDQLSGGERQRVAIARALVCEPTLLVCDEVTSALDVSVQASIVELLGGLQRELGVAMLFVTHNLPLVRSIAQRVAVLSEGTVVEVGAVGTVMAHPQAEYTRRLLADTPSLEAVSPAPR